MIKTWMLPSLVFVSTSFAAMTEQSQELYTLVEDKAQVKILNPSLEQRKVAKLVLKNGMKAYLVSDPGVDQSAAAVSVQAGSWNDPKEYPGMAHFLEHMLFMGNGAYPDEAEYMKFIRDNGGKVNAFTASDRTVYMFSINNEAFEGALDRFSHFFIDPLFSTSCINRELHAVDQEHAKNIENDGWREYMIFKETGNPDHPNSKFSTGNAKTLSGIPQKALKDWYAAHYSAEQMNLVLISSLPIEKMVELAVKEFSPVENRSVDNSLSRLPMFSSDQKGRMLFIKPVKDLRVVTLMWELPREYASVDGKWSADLAAYVLNEQSEQSLLKQLKKEKIAESLNAYTDRYSRDNVLFMIDIKLTEQGCQHIETAIARTFQAIAKLKQHGIPLELFDEMRTMAAIKYQYQSRDDAFDVISDMAYGLVDENIATFPEKTKIPSSYDPQSVTDLINSLTPDSCVYFVMVDPSKTGVRPDRREKWMAAEYAVKPIPESKLTALRQASAHPEIQLPPPNPYIPKNLSLVAEKPADEKTALPELIVDEDKAKIYFAADTRYMVPEVAMIFAVKSPLIDGTAKASAITDIYVKALSEKLSTPLYFASSAGLDAMIVNHSLKLTVAVQGYSEKAPAIASEIFKAMPNVAISQGEFEIYKDSFLSSYQNASKELPVRQAIEVLSSVVLNDSPTNQDKLRAIEDLTYEDYLSYVKDLFEKVYVEGMLYGNLTESQAASVWREIAPVFSSCDSYSPEEQKKRQVLVLSSQKGPYQIIENTERQGNGVVLMIEEGPFSFQKRASQQILSIALQDGFFDTLRTKQQTGYIAKAWDSEIERQLIQYFAVQSSTHGPTDLLMRFELFLEDFDKNLSTVISKDRFENLRKMLVKTLQMPPENMQGMAARLNLLAFDYNGDFSFIEKRIEALSNLSYDEMQRDAHLFLSRKNQKRLAVTVEGILPPENDFRYEAVARDELSTKGTFVTYRQE